MKKEIIHHLNKKYRNGIAKTVKRVKLFGFIIWQTTKHYPKIDSDVVELEF